MSKNKKEGLGVPVRTVGLSAASLRSCGPSRYYPSLKQQIQTTMSIIFPSVPNEEAIRLMEEYFGKPTASDGKTNLFDNLLEIEQRLARAVANAAGQPMSIEMNSVGDIKAMADGSRYQLTQEGWKKIEGEELNLNAFFVDEEARDQTADDLRALERFRLAQGIVAAPQAVGNPTELKS